MSWAAVNFDFVRYSPIEKRHYFYDPAYPTAVQFFLNERWEPWDVGWVRRMAQDPDIRRIAESAEKHLIQHNYPGYIPWPQSVSHPNQLQSWSGEAPPPPSMTTGESSFSATQNFSRNLSLGLNSISPQSYGPSDSSPVSQTASGASAYQAQPTRPTSTENHGTLRSPIEDFSPIGSYNLPEPPHNPANPVDGPIPSVVPANPSDSTHRPQPPLGSRETKVLLSIDGDGLRGLSSILLVESLVNAVCSKLGRRLDPYQIFDLMGGTSTGGVLAIMLGRLRMRPHAARDAYIDISKAMFRDKLHFFRSLNLQFQSGHDDQKLEDTIKTLVGCQLEDQEELFFDNRIDSTNVFVISTQVDVGVNRPVLIRSYPTRRQAGPEIHPDPKTWEVIHATSAAPRYLNEPGPIYLDRRTVLEPGLVDYGTGKNNPIRDLFYECRKLYNYNHDMMIIVSIGTGTGFNRLAENKEMGNSVEDRLAEARVAGMKFESDMKDLITRGWLKYFRFDVPGLDDIPLEEWSHMDEIMTKTHEYLAVPNVGHEFYTCVDAIAEVLTVEHNIW
ncbi:FabD/lysophospholipase-like protein [Zopfia rhizophila CBS 207.26]|uniref:FabD/lysophospholipase-like protein n=1 Tax=Zopfia rhizophila CBS 207.26 TaxID=1314779 RepID=A0A6A6DS02_9PEZI|nr:FabD/lysophospholipase-like protein [Zopfia rhizophila CBS 207.26]